MREVPEVDQFFGLFVEDCLLDLHLHLYHFCLQVFIHLNLRLFYQLLDVLLLEDPLQSFSVRNLKVT
jgi:hypothetical protein